MTDEDNKIKVFASDDNLKILGELLSNDTSRKIIYNLMNTEMYTNEIATKLDIRVSLVIHHLKKMEELGLVEITEKKIKRRGDRHRFFKIDSDIFVTINKTKKEIEEKGILKKIFRGSVKFTSIFVVGGFIWMYDLVNIFETKDTLPIPFGQSLQSYDSLVFALSIIIIGLVIERIFSYKKKKKGVSYH